MYLFIGLVLYARSEMAYRGDYAKQQCIRVITPTCKTNLANYPSLDACINKFMPCVFMETEPFNLNYVLRLLGGNNHFYDVVIGWPFLIISFPFLALVLGA